MNVTSMKFFQNVRGSVPVNLVVMIFLAAFLILPAGTVDAQVNLLSNYGFENGDTSLGWYGISNWVGAEQWGGMLIGTNNAHQGTNVMRMFAFASSSHILDQRIPVTAGQLYQMDGWLRTVSGAQQFKPTNGYCSILVQYYNSSGSKIGGNIDSSHMVTNGSTSWTKYTTGASLVPPNAVTARVSCLYVANSDATTNGWVEYDDMSATTTSVTRAGALINPDFEIQTVSMTLTNIPHWEPFGSAGGMVTNYSHSGRFSIQLYYTETLLGQSWAATAGTTYASSGYMLTTGITTTNNAHGVIMLQYLNATGGLLTTYSSGFITKTNATGTWIPFEASGLAPSGTASGRTMCAILGSDSAYSGSVFFDDMTQRVASTTGTVAGVLHNPGFDDGMAGNAYYMSSADFPYWTWLGGTNAGFVADTYSYDGSKSLSITYPDNMAGQRVAAVTGSTYILEGYMSSPVGQAISNNAYGVFYMEFYSTSYKSGTSLVSVVESPHFTSNYTAGSWYKFSITNTAPWTGSVTCRVLCAVMGNTTNYGGAVYFDGLSLIETNIARANSQSGALLNPGFEYTANGTVFDAVDNWTNFGNAGNIDNTYTRSGNRALKIYYPGQLLLQNWSATTGYTYTNAAYVYTPSGTDRFTGGTNTYALLVMEFLDATGTNSVGSFPSAWFRPTDSAGTWTKLAVTGKAPAGAVSARTMVGLLGWTTGFSGAVWFDDVSQGLSSTGGTTQAGAIYNGGFEDGVVGNCYYLSNSLPNWKWVGGSNAGFIVSGVAQSNDQSLTIVWPGNMACQDFNATTGRIYTVEGYMMTPSTARMTGTTAYATILLEFFNSIGTTTSVSVVNSIKLTNGTPADTWMRVAVTNRAPWGGTWVTGRVSCALLGGESNYGGQVYFDSVRVDVTTSALANTQSGALSNPGFEFSADGTKFPYIDSWTNFGDAGNTDSSYARTGGRSLKIYYPGQLLVQNWSATTGYTYTNATYVYTPTGTDRFTGSTNTYALLVMEFLDATGTNSVGSFPSAWFRPTDSAGTWTKLAVTGKAPVGAVSARTMVGLLGWTTGFSGAVWFDDVSQGVSSTGGTTQAGAIYNGGFEDGVVGNCYYLSNNMPNWKWFGGTNAGFIVSGVAQSNDQSLTIVWPNNLAAQDFTAQTGLTYTVEGYMMTPSANRMTGSTAYAQFMLEFFTAAGGSTSVSVVGSAKLTNGTPADTWIHVAVTNRAPYTGTWVTGRVSCAYMDTIGGTVGGQVYFDSVRVSVTTVTVNNTTNGAIRNPGFDYSANGTRLSFIDNWQGLGLDGTVDSTYKRSGAQSLKIYVSETLAAQSWPATPGYRYSSQAYAYTPAESEGSDMLVNGSLSLVGVAQAPTSWSSFDDGSHEADYWHVQSPTNAWMFYWSGGIYQDVTTGFVPGERVKFGGSFFMEGGNAFTNSKYGAVQLEFYDSTDALISSVYAYPFCDTSSVHDAWFGTAGSANVPADTAKIRVIVRCNTPSGTGDGTFTADDIFLKKVPTVAEKFTSPYDAHGVVLLQYLNVTGGVVATYESPYFTTNSAADSWSNLYAVGVAPAGTVSGRTVVAILGSGTGFGGALWFDDISQSLVSTGTTQAGLIYNGGFDDGVGGNCNYLSNDLPAWVWAGGTNAGFIVTDTSHSNGQSLAIVYPNNLLQQDFAATTGLLYVVDGYMMTPSANQMTSTTAYATFLLEFFNSSGGATSVSVVSTAKLTKDTAADTWIKFSVTNRAPWTGGQVTGRVSCALLDLDNTPYGGAVYFDSVQVTVFTNAISNSQNGNLWNPGFEYTADGTKLPFIDSWTGLGLAGNVDSAYKRTGNNALKIYAPETLLAQTWSATSGWRYSSSAYVATPATSDRLQGASNMHAVVLLQYVNSTGGVLATYESAYFSTNNAAGTWTNLSVSGVAPAGTVSGKTIVGVLGTNAGFAGGVWFDDVSQGLVSTGLTQSGVIYNGGFDDGIGGNVYYLSNDLPRWKWAGGTNAGFIVTDTSYSNGQSLVIVAANNLLQQDFTATAGLTYTVEGYMMTPSANKMTGTTAYATFLLEFFNPAGGWSTSVSAVTTANLTKDTAADTWIKFSVTNRAPWTGPVTGRVSCAILDLESSPYGGVVYFDSVRVSVTTVNVANTQSGALWNPGFEYTANGTKLAYLDNWTGLGFDGSIDGNYKRSGDHALKIFYTETMAAQGWAATQGWKYSSSAYAFTPSDTGANLVTNPELTGTGTAPDSWSQWNDGSHDPNTTYYRSSANSWVFYWEAGIYQDITNGFNVGEVMSFGGYFYMASGNPLRNGDKHGAYYLECYDASSNVLASAASSPTISSNSAQDTWILSGGTLTVPSGTVRIRLVSQCIQTTGGDGVYMADDVFVQRSNGTANQFQSLTNTHAVVLLQYVNSTGGVLATYESAYFTPSNPADTWTNLTVSGVAPMGTVTGKTIVGILGGATGYSGAVWFDDVSQGLVSTGLTQSGVIYNGGFDDGIGGNVYYLSNDLPRWTWAGGTNAGFIVNDASQSNDQSLVIVAANNLLQQDFTATTAMSYIVEGYMMTPSANKMTGTTAYATFLLEFFNPAGTWTSSVSVVSSEKLTKDSPADTWIKFSVTNRAPLSGPVTGRVSCAILDLESSPYGGVVYFDSVRVTTTNIVVTNSQSGALWDPGFEFSANGTKLPYMDSWTGLGLAGNVESAYKRSGSQSLKIYSAETLVAQTWNATHGWRYSSSAYVFTPSDDPFEGVAAHHAVVLLQFLDATNGVLVTYESSYFTTNSAADTWTNLYASGVAPAGTVYGRTLLGVLGTNAGYGGSILFDDVSQSLVSTGGTSSGLLHNPGFEDGPPGNVYSLVRTNDLPSWKWFGGDNAGYISTDVSKDGQQSFVLTWPQNSLGQDVAVTSGKQYVAEGYLYTPTTAKFNSDGSSWGWLEMTFYVNGDTNPVTENTAVSAKFEGNRPANQWIYFAVTGTAPNASIVTARLSCVIYSSDPGSDFDLAGAIFFDQLSMTEQGSASEFEQWQVQYFGSTSGPNTGATEDYDNDGFSNWSEFIAGTDPTQLGSCLVVDPSSNRLANNKFILSWPSVTGRYYGVRRSTNGMSGTFSVISNNIPATVPLNVFTDTPPVDIGSCLYRITVTTNQP